MEGVGNNAALPPDVLRPAATASGIVFGAVTDAQQREGFPPESTFAFTTLIIPVYSRCSRAN
jgi:hypothetical protein